MYQQSIGPLGFWVFVVGACATLYSTAFAATAANCRLLADVLPMLGLMSETDDPETRVKRIKLFGVIIPLYCTVLYIIWPAPLSFILLNGVGQAILLPFIAGCALYLRHRRLTAELRPGMFWTMCLWLSAAALTFVGVWQIISRF
jgi:hypothetical protein